MITLGADPEIFVGKAGSFVSAHGLVPGTKRDPFKVNKGAVQVDGLALEFNIDPAASYEEFQGNLDTVMDILKSMVPDYDFLNVAAVELDKAYKDSLPPESLEIGCEPDFNAYTEELNEGPNPNSSVRAVGGHIHIGGIFTEQDTKQQRFETALRMVRLMDKHVGMYSLLWDEDNTRRTIYGKAGACRLKSYGVEYRSLSNKWLFDKKITRFVYDNTMKAVEALFRGEDVESDVYRHIIDNSQRHHPMLRGVAI